jgi:branched-chain amino acid transport system substrate-binding protein
MFVKALFRRRRRWLLAGSLASLAAVAVVAAASASAATSSRTSLNAKPPIVIGLSAMVFPGAFDGVSQSLDGLRPALRYIKDHGGWGGRALKVPTCQSDGSTAGDEKCLREMVGAKAATVLGLLLDPTAAELPILSQAGIPFFDPSNGPVLGTPWENALSGGAVGVYGAAGRYVCGKGSRRCRLS